MAYDAPMAAGHPVTQAVRALRQAKVDFVPHLYPWEPRGGTAASSAALGVAEHLVIKTLIFEDDARRPLCILMHGDREVSAKNLARTLGVKQVVLVGNALGGEIAWQTAVLAPDRVSKLVLIDADGYQPSVLSMPIAFQIASMRGLRWVSERILPKAMVAASVRSVFGAPSKATQDKIDRYFELNLRVGNRRALFQRMDQAQFGNNATLIRRVSQPTLVMWGERDEMIAPEHGTLFCQDIQRCRLVTYPALGHLPQEEDPEGTLPDLVSFLAN